MSRDTIREVLENCLSLPGVLAVVLVSDQGLIISDAGIDREVDSVDIVPPRDVIAALVMDTLAVAQSLGRDANIGSLATVLLDYDDLGVMLVPFDKEMILVLIAEPGSLSVGCLAGAYSGRTDHPYRT